MRHRLRRAGLFLDAVGTWLLKHAARILVHYVYASNNPLETVTSSREDDKAAFSSRLVTLTKESDLDALPKEKIDYLARHSGRAPARIISNGGRIYALKGPDGILAQLNVNFGTFPVSTPVPLEFELAPDAFFISFLYTAPEHRDRGYARKLMNSTFSVLVDEGFARGLCHIRSTNMASRASFRCAGWRCEAMILATRSGRLLATPGVRRVGLKVSPSIKPRGAGDAADAP
ncbi:GNAT family N-acetyltransferase [Alkalilimnicola ehrlichii MLHE-1]|uniref:GNAT family N-acetyltransferase n=1 Tax=Alkalilimnicola ehrlichii TaxID=351052 RepID=UPI0009FE7C75